jgi:hypothetical protein
MIMEIINILIIKMVVVALQALGLGNMRIDET